MTNYRIWLAIIIGIYVLLAAGYSAVTPAATPDQHNPDENAHMLYIRALSQGHLPVFKAGRNDYESHQPPLYYALSLPVYAAAKNTGDAGATKAVRWVSILLGALLVLVIFKTALLIFPSEPRLALASAMFAALLPGHVALAASVTNDTLSNLLVAVALWKLTAIVMRLDKERSRMTKAALLGLALGLGIWTKTTTMVMFPVVVVAFALLAYGKQLDGRAAMKLVGVSVGLGLLIGSPWLIRNQMLYGDPVAQKVFVSSFGNTATTDVMLPFFGSLTAYFQAVYQWTFASFWGVFDSMRLFWGQDPHGRTPSPKDPLGGVYLAIVAMCVANLCGLLLLVHRRWAGLVTDKKVMAWTLTALCAVTAYVFLRFNLVFFQAQGRYLYPALAPFALCSAAGLRGLFPRLDRFSMSILVVGAALLGLNVYSIFWLLAPRFAGP